MDSRRNIVFSICHLESGQAGADSVFPDSALIRGTIRCYDLDAKAKMIERITKIAQETAKAYNCEAKVNIFDKYPAVVNHPEQTDHVIRLCKAHFGEDNFSQDELPLSAGEDFSYFL